MKSKLDFRLIFFDGFRLLQILFFLHLSSHSFINAIKFYELYIPERIELGKPVDLICHFELEQSESLYSVKWYKNNLEFFRYLNSSSNQHTNNNWQSQKDGFTYFPQAGIHLDKRKSNTTHVVLKKSDFNTEGQYECEVSISSLNTVIASRDLRIYVLPRSPLQFTVAQDDKQVNAMCQSFSSKPASLVYFLLNGQLIKRQLYKYLDLGDLITSRKNDDPLVSSTLSIRIPVNNLPKISQLVNSIEYRQYKIDSSKHETTTYDLSKPDFKGSDTNNQDSIKSERRIGLTMKRDLLNEYIQLTDQQIVGLANLENEAKEFNSKFNRMHRNSLNELKMQTMNSLNEQTRHRSSDNSDQLHKQNSLTSIREAMNSARLNKTIHQFNGSKNSIEQNSNVLFSSNAQISSPSYSKFISNDKLSSISKIIQPRSEALIFDANEDNLSNENDLGEHDKSLKLSCVSTIAQPIGATYDELNLEENAYLERKHEQQDQYYAQINYMPDEFSIPRITNEEELTISPNQILTLNCTVHLLQPLYRLQPILKFYINDREAHIDELIPYNNQELYDKNVFNFSSTYTAYALLQGNLLKQFRGNNTSNASLKNQQQPSYLNDKNKFKLRSPNKRRRLSSITLGLRMHLTKEHFQNDGNVKLRCTCTYFTLLKQDVQNFQLLSSSKKSWFSSNARRSSFASYEQ